MKSIFWLLVFYFVFISFNLANAAEVSTNNKVSIGTGGVNFGKFITQNDLFSVGASYEHDRNSGSSSNSSGNSYDVFLGYRRYLNRDDLSKYFAMRFGLGKSTGSNVDSQTLYSVYLGAGLEEFTSKTFSVEADLGVRVSKSHVHNFDSTWFTIPASTIAMNYYF